MDQSPQLSSDMLPGSGQLERSPSSSATAGAASCPQPPPIGETTAQQPAQAAPSYAPAEEGLLPIQSRSSGRWAPFRLIETVDYVEERLVWRSMTTDELHEYLFSPRARWVHVNGANLGYSDIIGFISDKAKPSLGVKRALGSREWNKLSLRPMVEWTADYVLVACTTHSNIQQVLKQHGWNGWLISRWNTTNKEPAIPPPSTPTKHDGFNSGRVLKGVDLATRDDFKTHSPHLNDLSDNATRKELIHVYDQSKNAVYEEFIKFGICVDQLLVILLRDGRLFSTSQHNFQHRSLDDCAAARASNDNGAPGPATDPSLLFAKLLRNVADDTDKVVDEFRELIVGLRARVLVKADADFVRDLHIISAELRLFKSSIGSLAPMFRQLCDPDQLDRNRATTSQGDASCSASRVSLISPAAAAEIAASHAKIEALLEDLDLFSELCESMGVYVVNALNFSAGYYVQALSLISVVFVPIGFLATYLAVPNITDSHQARRFWTLGVPIGFGMLVLFSWRFFYEQYKVGWRENVAVKAYFGVTRIAQRMKRKLGDKEKQA